jgi:plastocyanin
VVHVLDSLENLPHDQDFYDHQAGKEQVLLLADASLLKSRGTYEDGATGAGSQTASLMRFGRGTIIVGVGDTVEWISLDPSINHTVTFGEEPADPGRPPQM